MGNELVHAVIRMHIAMMCLFMISQKHCAALNRTASYRATLQCSRVTYLDNVGRFRSLRWSRFRWRGFQLGFFECCTSYTVRCFLKGSLRSHCSDLSEKIAIAVKGNSVSLLHEVSKVMNVTLIGENKSRSSTYGIALTSKSEAEISKSPYDESEGD